MKLVAVWLSKWNGVGGCGCPIGAAYIVWVMHIVYCGMLLLFCFWLTNRLHDEESCILLLWIHSWVEMIFLG